VSALVRSGARRGQQGLPPGIGASGQHADNQPSCSQNVVNTSAALCISSSFRQQMDRPVWRKHLGCEGIHSKIYNDSTVAACAPAVPSPLPAAYFDANKIPRLLQSQLNRQPAVMCSSSLSHIPFLSHRVTGMKPLTLTLYYSLFCIVGQLAPHPLGQDLLSASTAAAAGWREHLLQSLQTRVCVKPFETHLGEETTRTCRPGAAAFVV
jgi:hypothetical protein